MFDNLSLGRLLPLKSDVEGNTTMSLWFAVLVVLSVIVVLVLSILQIVRWAKGEAAFENMRSGVSLKLLRSMNPNASASAGNTELTDHSAPSPHVPRHADHRVLVGSSGTGRHPHGHRREHFAGSNQAPGFYGPNLGAAATQALYDAAHEGESNNQWAGGAVLASTGVGVEGLSSRDYAQGHYLNVSRPLQSDNINEASLQQAIQQGHL